MTGSPAWTPALVSLAQERGFLEEPSIRVNERGPLDVAGRGNATGTLRTLLRSGVLGNAPSVDHASRALLQCRENIAAPSDPFGAEADFPCPGAHLRDSNSDRPTQLLPQGKTAVDQADMIHA